MTDHDETTEARRPGRLARVWKWSGETYTSLRTAAVIFVLVGLAFVSIRGVDSAVNDRNSRQAIHQAEMAAWENEHDTWIACRNQAISRGVTREEAVAAVNYLDTVLAALDRTIGPIPEEAKTALAVARASRLNDIDRARPALDPADCGEEPTPPTPPED